MFEVHFWWKMNTLTWGAPLAARVKRKKGLSSIICGYPNRIIVLAILTNLNTYV